MTGVDGCMKLGAQSESAQLFSKALVCPGRMCSSDMLKLRLSDCCMIAARENPVRSSTRRAGNVRRAVSNLVYGL